MTIPTINSVHVIILWCLLNKLAYMTCHDESVETKNRKKGKKINVSFSQLVILLAMFWSSDVMSDGRQIMKSADFLISTVVTVTTTSASTKI